MSTSRSESQLSRSSRPRSSTSQSILRPIPSATPISVGESTILNAWVHDSKESTSVILNPAYWPGVTEGDLLRVASKSNTNIHQTFLFTVPRDDGFIKPQLQISIPQTIATAFGMHNNEEVIATKVAKETYSADYVEFFFQDQYLGRNDMWRMGKNLVGQCVHQDQDVSFIGSVVAKAQHIYIRGEKVTGAFMTSATKCVYRSLSARFTIYIQVCRELWQFAGDGERYNEKIVHSFLPALFAKWREAGTNHTVTIVLVSRVYYDASELDYAAGPLRQDDLDRWYKDFFKVITDLEVLQEWKPTLVSLKTSFWDFQRDILLTHHYHRSAGDIANDEPVRLVGRISYAHDGPILEALNLGLNPTETHYIDRSLSLTGATFMLITPGTGWFRVSKQLLRLTTTRVLDQGTGMDLVCLAKPPLHLTPIFAFQGPDIDSSSSNRVHDPLWEGDEHTTAGSATKVFWWEPFFVSISFWDHQMDLPFRKDRFVARARMHEIEMLGLLAQDVLSSIEVPYLSSRDDQENVDSPLRDVEQASEMTKEQADRFDLDLFSHPSEIKKPPNNLNRHSLPANSVSSSYTSTSSVRSGTASTPAEKRASTRISTIGLSAISPIEESPGGILMELPPESDEYTSQHMVGSAIFSSPRTSSPASFRSVKSALPGQTKLGSKSTGTTTKPSLASKITSGWLRNPFRGGPSEPQASNTSTSAISSTPSATPQANPLKLPSTAKPTIAESPNMPILMAAQSQSSLNYRAIPQRASTAEDDSILPSRLSITRRSSPINTPPRDDAALGNRRRSGMAHLSSSVHTPPSSSPISRTNPSKLDSKTISSSSSLARRWQHFSPQVSYKGEIKWKSLVTPACLPLTVEYFPSAAELESSYDFFSYDFVIDPEEMKSFLVRPPAPGMNVDDTRRAWALAVMKGMTAVRLAQGFQFVLAPSTQNTSQDKKDKDTSSKSDSRRNKSFVMEGGEDLTPRASGASQVLLSTTDPVYLSMSNEIHRISYTGEAVQVGRYVRRMPVARPFEYQCLIWPKLGIGYTELSTKFESHGLEGYGWNRLDMLVAGYEQQFNESLRYWRTRFVVIPTIEPPQVKIGPSGEKLNHEEARIVGVEKLAEQFSKLRFTNGDRELAPSIRFLPTTLTPAMSILDDALMEQLDQIHAAGPMRKKIKSEREIDDMSLVAIAKAMHEPDGVPVKHYQWHNAHYPNAFTGFDFISWLVREFQDVSSRSQGLELGIKFQEQGLFEHCRGHHNFLDGHYFYRLKGEYAVPMTPKNRWFAYRRPMEEITTPGKSVNSPRRPRRRLILSQTMVVDLDPGQKSDQAESVLLHHDIIHNPATVFHFELQWIGTTARCIEDNLRQWNRTVERYGLKLVEVYVTQISDVEDRNVFQSCFPIPLAIPPPTIPDLAKRVPEGTHTAQYFEYALLQKFDFLVDIEAGNLYPEQVDVMYSYRRSSFKYSQFVHREGVAFVQVLGGCKGFLFLTNRLMGSGRIGKGNRPSIMAEDIRRRLQHFCGDPDLLSVFYEEQIRCLKSAPAVEDPPELAI